MNERIQGGAICFFNGNRAWGGGEKWHRDFALMSRDEGRRTLVVAARGSALAARLAGEPGIELALFSLGNLSFLNPVTLFRLWRLFRERGVEVVVMALPSDVKAGGIAAWLAGVPARIFRRGMGLPTRDTWFNRFLFRRVLTGLIHNSEDTLRNVLKHNPALIPAGRIHLVHNGVDVAGLDRLPAHPLVERRPGEVLVGTAGRLTAQKGQRCLIEAARLLKDRGLRFRVLIAGQGELEGELKDLAARLDVLDRVEFLGFVEDMKSFLQTLDVFALPSLWEGASNALVEAMALGLPVAAFRVSSIPEMVEEGVTGLLAPPGDSGNLAACLEVLLASPCLARRMGLAGRRKVLEHYDLPQVRAEFELAIRT